MRKGNIDVRGSRRGGKLGVRIGEGMQGRGQARRGSGTCGLETPEAQEGHGL